MRIISDSAVLGQRNHSASEVVGVYLETLTVAQTMQSLMMRWLMNNRKGRGSKHTWHNLKYCVGVIMQKLWKATKTLVKIAALRPKIWNQDHPNMKQES